MDLYNKIIAGPCSAETEEQVMETAKQLHDIGIKIFRAGAWKPRTKPGQFEGNGLNALKWMKKAKDTYGLKLATEIATPEHVKLARLYDIDYIWIGARTTTDPFAVQEIADFLNLRGEWCKVYWEYFDKIYVKNPVSPDIELWVGAIQRLLKAGVPANKIGAIHRGFCLYDNSVYRNVPMWQIGQEFHKRLPEIELICDPSHISGKRDLIAPICQQAINLEYDGLMIESHCWPDKAWTDAKQQITPDVLKYIIDNIHDKPNNNEKAISQLAEYRDQIDMADNKILYALADRLKICKKIGKLKKENNLTVFQPDRYNQVLNHFVENGSLLGLDKELTTQIFNDIHEESVHEQTEIVE